MQEINWSLVSTVISAFTAIVAIFAPVITTAITAKSQERIKEMEMYSPRVYDALSEMSETYAHLYRRDMAKGDDESQRAQYIDAICKYNEFMAASYKVMSLMPGENIHHQISELIASLGSSFCPHADDDKLFCNLMNDINTYMRTSKVKKEK